ncbi:MAG: SYNERG-CTERM sorting domain-containing protein [Synergistaceae bacterium]|nr:SYNERG-CTERM sorting domain-containing protein [Synergistaceae bacterium]
MEKGGGCDAGFGAGAALAVLAACLAARKQGKN